MTERVWSRQDIEDRVNVLRERYDGEAFADAVAEFSKELEPEEQEDLREILLERSREHAARTAALDDRIERGGWLRRTLGSTERTLRREQEKNRRRLR
jgi:biopolymer transport protein ExbB/TolQ